MEQMKVLSIGTGVTVVLYGTGLLWTIINTVLVVGFAVLGLYCGIACALNTNRKYIPSTKPLPERSTTVLFQRMRVGYIYLFFFITGIMFDESLKVKNKKYRVINIY